MGGISATQRRNCEFVMVMGVEYRQEVFCLKKVNCNLYYKNSVVQWRRPETILNPSIDGLKRDHYDFIIGHRGIHYVTLCWLCCPEQAWPSYIDRARATKWSVHWWVRSKISGLTYKHARPSKGNNSTDLAPITKWKSPQYSTSNAL